MRLAEVERIAFEFPAARVFHMYQEPDAQIRGIAIYESGRRTSLRHMEGARFLVDDWLSFPTARSDQRCSRRETRWVGSDQDSSGLRPAREVNSAGGATSCAVGFGNGEEGTPVELFVRHAPDLAPLFPSTTGARSR